MIALPPRRGSLLLFVLLSMYSIPCAEAALNRRNVPVDPPKWSLRTWTRSVAWRLLSTSDAEFRRNEQWFVEREQLRRQQQLDNQRRMSYLRKFLSAAFFVFIGYVLGSMQDKTLEDGFTALEHVGQESLRILREGNPRVLSALNSILQSVVAMLDRLLSSLPSIFRSTLTTATVVFLVISTIALILFYPLLARLGKAIHDDMDTMTPLGRPNSRTSKTLRKIARMFDGEAI